MVYFMPIPQRGGRDAAARRADHASQRQGAYALLAYALDRELGLDLFALAVARGERGKPYLPGRADVCFNLSHCAGAVACALDGAPVGVDVEPTRPFDARVAQRVFTPEEIALVRAQADPDGAFTRLWTLKESAAKRSGAGLHAPFRQMRFTQLNPPAGSGFSGEIAAWRAGNYWIAACAGKTPGPLVAIAAAQVPWDRAARYIQEAMP
ncbi:MAG: 4'-phosphopantetheinyl transferase family protein [Christensenellales bacterium]|jgi:phosphopantetheinyl transferase